MQREHRCEVPAARVRGVSTLVRKVRGLPGLLGVAVPAAVAAHCLGYEVASRLERVAGPLTGGTSHGGHAAHAGEVASVHASHLPLIPLTSGALLVAAVALLSGVVTIRRVADTPRVGLWPLLLAQLAVMGLIEFAGWATDASPAAGPVVLALMAQVPVAVIAFHLCREVHQMVVRLVCAGAARRLTTSPPAVCVAPDDVRPDPLVWALACPGRGPPSMASV